jgi:hypothetical protein
VSESCYAQLQVIGEPRLSVSQNGPLRIIEAIDEKGQSLIPPRAPSSMMQRSAGYFGLNAGAVVQLQATLTRPELPGRVIRKLHGAVPVTVATRKPTPLVIKLDGATGKTFRNDDVAVTISELRALPNTRQTVIELSVRSLTGGPPSATAGGQPEFAVQRPESILQTIEVTDSRGRSLPWYQTNFDLEAGRITLTVTPQALEGNTAPAEVRFYGLSRATAEVEFEFKELPLP